MMNAPATPRPTTVLTKEEADKRAMVYKPREFPATVNAAAVEFVKYQTGQENPAFKIDHVVSITSGIADLEKLALSERVETEALERLKGLQEEAYKQGYDLGRDEGQHSAYQEKTTELEAQLERMTQILQGMETLKAELVKQNEASLIGLAFELAKRMAHAEISLKPDLILQVLSQVAGEAQEEESVTIRLSESDLAFIESHKARLGKGFETVKKARLEGSSDINSGGCVVVTNYGQVDATVEMRIKKVWEALSEVMPKRSDVASAPGSDE